MLVPSTTLSQPRHSSRPHVFLPLLPPLCPGSIARRESDATVGIMKLEDVDQPSPDFVTPSLLLSIYTTVLLRHCPIRQLHSDMLLNYGSRTHVSTVVELAYASSFFGHGGSHDAELCQFILVFKLEDCYRSSGLVFIIVL